MSTEVTSKKYWDDYWGEGEAKFPTYSLTSGLFSSYKLLLDECFDRIRRQTGRTRLSVIDCGCGEGLIMRFIAEQFEDVEVWGIEYSDAIEKARGMGERLNLPFNLVCGDLLKEWDPQFIGKFDAVISFGLIEHFERPNEILSQMAKALTPGGSMITVIPNFEGLFHFFWRLYDRKNYAYHIPVAFDVLGNLHKEIGLENIKTVRLGTPCIPGIHNPTAMWEKILRRIIVNINGRILKKIYPRQEDLSQSYRMVPAVAAFGFKPDND